MITRKFVYSSSFDANSDHQTTATWPAPGGITEDVARRTCRNIIVDPNVIGTECFNNLANDTSTADIVQACVDDVQVRLPFVF